MMVKPSVTELLTKADNRYELVIATSRRARQIVQKKVEEKNVKKGVSGSNSSNKTKDESAVTIAATEIAEEKVKIIEPQEKEGE